MNLMCCSTLARIVYFQVLCLPTLIAYYGLTAREPILSLELDLQQRFKGEGLEGGGGRKQSTSEHCEMLKLPRRQRRMCRRGRGIPETLVEAARIAVLECHFQFQHERWNCSLGQHHHAMLEKGFKETSFLYAISSAGLVHAFARACSRGVLDRCTCDESDTLENRKAWLWGGCGDNIRFGIKFTRKFLKRSRKTNKDMRAKVDQHNTRVGIKVVKDNVNATCKCHGVSGSCTVKTCWLQLTPFHRIGAVLKRKYDNSLKVGTFTNQATGKPQLVQRVKNSKTLITPRRGDLVFIEDSPSYCIKSRFSPGTRGRVCSKDRNCDSTCCGRGYNVQHVRVKHSCKCKVIWCCHVDCEECERREEIYMCK